MSDGTARRRPRRSPAQSHPPLHPATAHRRSPPPTTVRSIPARSRNRSTAQNRRPTAARHRLGLPLPHLQSDHPDVTAPPHEPHQTADQLQPVRTAEQCASTAQKDRRPASAPNRPGCRAGSRAPRHSAPRRAGRPEPNARRARGAPRWRGPPPTPRHCSQCRQREIGPLIEQRKRNSATAGSHVGHAPPGRQPQPDIHQQFRLRPRDQHPWIDGQHESPKRLLAEDVGNWLTGGPSIHSVPYNATKSADTAS